jgi:hypothetical protein
MIKLTTTTKKIEDSKSRERQHSGFVFSLVYPRRNSEKGRSPLIAGWVNGHYPPTTNTLLEGWKTNPYYKLGIPVRLYTSNCQGCIHLGPPPH